MAARRFPDGPGRLDSVLGASVADSLESIARTVDTCTSWSEASDLDPGADFADGESAQNPARREDVALHMRREQERNVAADMRRQMRHALDQTGWHAAMPPPDTYTAALPNILETEHEPVHTPEFLHAIISRFNSLETKSGAVGKLLDACANSIGLAVANVPTSMIVFTSRPLTAILTRWPMIVFLFGYAIVFLYPCILDARTAVWGRSVSMQWLKVHEVKVFESVFPILGSEDTRLTLVDAGVYDQSLNRRLIPGCNSTLSESSFEIRCADVVEIRGIWLHVVGPNKQVSRGWPSQPRYKHAGIEYAHTIGADFSEQGGVRSPGIGDVYSVMGTGQTMSGRTWEVRPSQTSSDGIYRLPAPAAQAPLLERPTTEILRYFAYSWFGMVLLTACAFAVLGKPRVAKHVTVISAVFAAIMFFAMHFIEAVEFFAQERRLACVLFGVSRGFRIDTTCGTVPPGRNCLSCDTALAIVLINLAYSLVWFPLAWNMWREKNFHQAFCCCVPVAIFELTLFCIHEHLANKHIALAALVCVFIYLIAAQTQFRLKRRLAMIMCADKDFYDRWWQALGADPSNRRALAQLSALDAEISKRLRSSHSPFSSAPAASSGRVLLGRWTGSVCERFVCRLLALASPLVRALGPPAVPSVRQMTCKSADEVDLMRFFAPAEVLYDNHCDAYMNYAFRPNPIKLFSRMQREGTMEVCRSIDTLYLQATCLRPFLARKMDQLMRENACLPGTLGFAQTSLKKPTRTVQKAVRVYGDDCSLLLDICRGVMVFDGLDHLHGMLRRLERDPEVNIVRIKNRLDKGYDSALSWGYRDVMINVQLKTLETQALNVHHHIAELQLVPRAVYERRNGGTSFQKLISLWRDLKEGGDTCEWLTKIIYFVSTTKKYILGIKN